MENLKRKICAFGLFVGLRLSNGAKGFCFSKIVDVCFFFWGTTWSSIIYMGVLYGTTHTMGFLINNVNKQVPKSIGITSNNYRPPTGAVLSTTFPNWNCRCSRFSLLSCMLQPKNGFRYSVFFSLLKMLLIIINVKRFEAPLVSKVWKTTKNMLNVLAVAGPASVLGMQKKDWRWHV